MAQLHVDAAPNIPEPDDKEEILAVSMHPLDPLVALATGGSLIKIYNIKSFTFEESLPQVGKVHSIDFSPCGHYLAAAASSQSQGLFLINIFGVDHQAGGNVHFTLETDDTYLGDTDDCKGPMKLHQDDITVVRFRPSKVVGAPCATLVSGSRDQTVRFWFFEHFDETMERVSSREHSGTIRDITFSDQGRLMCSIAEDVEYPGGSMTVWKFNYNKELELDQLMRIPFLSATVNCVRFFSFHTLVPNPYGDHLREFWLTVGTSKGIRLYMVSQTKAPPDQVLDWPKMLVHGAESVRQLDPFEELDEDEDDAKQQASNYVGLRLDHERSFRELKGHAEMLYNDAGDDAADRSFQYTNLLNLEQVDFIATRESVTALSSTEHLSIPDDPWRKVYGCNVVAYGTDKGSVHIVTLSALRKRERKDNQYGPHYQCRLEGHDAPVTGIGLPSVQLNIALQRERYLGDQQHFIISASLDETVRIIKWNCEPLKDWEDDEDAKDIPHEFIPRGRDAKDSAVTLERPVTKHVSLQLSALREIVRKTGTEAKELSREEEVRRENMSKYGYLSGEMTMEEVQEQATELKRKGVLKSKKTSVFSTLGRFEKAAQVAAGQRPEHTIKEEVNSEEEMDEDDLKVPVVAPQPSDDEVIRAATEYTPKPTGVVTKHFIPVPGRRYKERRLESGISKLKDFETLAQKNEKKNKGSNTFGSRMCGPVTAPAAGQHTKKGSTQEDGCVVM